jgi:hypothetical protein
VSRKRGSSSQRLRGIIGTCMALPLTSVSEAEATMRGAWLRWLHAKEIDFVRPARQFLKPAQVSFAWYRRICFGQARQNGQLFLGGNKKRNLELAARHGCSQKPRREVDSVRGGGGGWVISSQAHQRTGDNVSVGGGAWRSHQRARLCRKPKREIVKTSTSKCRM